MGSFPVWDLAKRRLKEDPLAACNYFKDGYKEKSVRVFLLVANSTETSCSVVHVGQRYKIFSQVRVATWGQISWVRGGGALFFGIFKPQLLHNTLAKVLLASRLH